MAGIGLIFLAFAVASVVIGVKSWQAADRRAARLERCLPAKGIVVKLKATQEVGTFPVVRFTDAEGVERESETASSRRSTWPGIGYRVNLRYDPEDPKWIVVDGMPSPAGQARAMSVAFFVLGVVCAANTVVFFMAAA